MSSRGSSSSPISQRSGQSQEASTSTQAQRPRPGPSAYSRAPKGKACLNCRRRKLKCDCAHPVCSQCIRLGREKDCEYTEKDQRSRTEILEENIAVLQARLRELEHAGAPTSELNYSSSLQSAPGEDVDMQEHSSPHSLGSRSSPEIIRQLSPAHASRTIAERLIEAFLPHATDFGFFLHKIRFLRWADQHLPLRSPSPLQSPPPDAQDNDPLLSVVYLWGATLSSDADLRAQDGAYLTDAIQRLSTAFRSTDALLLRIALGFNVDDHWPDIVHVLQAEVLLANYFYHEGRFVEARQHTASAVTLALSCGLHQIRPSTVSQPAPVDASKFHLVPAADASLKLPPPVDLVEEGERISAFWQVYILDKTWAHLSGLPSLLVTDGSPRTRIDTPWPLAMQQYVEGAIPHEYGQHGQTLERFFPESQDTQLDSRLSALALRAQAASLLDKAAWLASICASDPERQLAHQGDFDTLDNMIEQFILGLPPISSFQNTAPPPPPELARSLTLTHTLARLAVVQLHLVYMNQIASRAKSLSASKAIIGAFTSTSRPQLGVVDPLMPIVLTASAHLIVHEIARIKGTPPQQPSLTCCDPYYLTGVIGEIISLISVMNPSSRLTAL